MERSRKKSFEFFVSDHNGQGIAGSTKPSAAPPQAGTSRTLNKTSVGAGITTHPSASEIKRTGDYFAARSGHRLSAGRHAAGPSFGTPNGRPQAVAQQAAARSFNFPSKNGAGQHATT